MFSVRVLTPVPLLVLLGGAVALSARAQEASMQSALTIELRLDGVPQVNRARMTAFGQRVSAQMPTLRECATRVMQRTPEAQGDIAVIAFAERTALRVTVDNDGVGNAQLLRCVRALLDNVTLNGLERPTGARVTFSFHNTLGHARAAAREAEARETEVPLTRSGANYVARGTFGLIELEIEADSADNARAFFSRARAALPILYDCRRRAGRREHDPSALFRLQVVARGSELVATFESAEIWDPMGSTCVTRALRRRANTMGIAPTGRARMVIRYLPGA